MPQADDEGLVPPVKVLRKRLNGVYRADGFSGPTRRYVLIVAMLVGLASLPTLAAITAGSNELDEGPAGALDVPFLPPASSGPIQPTTPPSDGGGTVRGQAEPQKTKPSQGYAQEVPPRDRRPGTAPGALPGSTPGQSGPKTARPRPAPPSSPPTAPGGGRPDDSSPGDGNSDGSPGDGKPDGSPDGSPGDGPESGGDPAPGHGSGGSSDGDHGSGSDSDNDPDGNWGRNPETNQPDKPGDGPSDGHHPGGGPAGGEDSNPGGDPAEGDDSDPGGNGGGTGGNAGGTPPGRDPAHPQHPARPGHPADPDPNPDRPARPNCHERGKCGARPSHHHRPDRSCHRQSDHATHRAHWSQHRAGRSRTVTVHIEATGRHGHHRTVRERLDRTVHTGRRAERSPIKQVIRPVVSSRSSDRSETSSRSSDRSETSRRSAMSERPQNIRPARVLERTHNSRRHQATDVRPDDAQGSKYRGSHRAERQHRADDSPAHHRSSRVGRHHADHR